MKALAKDIYAPSVKPGQTRGNALIITADKTEDLEFFYPYYRLTEAGYRVDVATPDGGKFEGKHGIGLQETLRIEDVEAGSYDLLYIPGGKAPAALRKNEGVTELVQDFVQTGKLVGALCHGPQVLVTAGLVRGRKIAAWPEVAEEIREAGGIYMDEACVIDGKFITGRWPGDLPAFMHKMLEMLEAGAVNQTRRAAGAGR